MRGAVLALLVAGCTTGIGGTGPSGSGYSPTCVSLENKTFETPYALECGLGPNGPATCIWHIKFDGNDQFTWQHSDVEESGHVTCTGSTITGMTTSTQTYNGTFDPTSGDLTWQGQLYHPM